MVTSGRGEVILAPMAAYTHSAFRRLCRRLGADRTYTELISATGILRNGIPMRYAFFTEEERPLHLQIFGSSPEEIARAAYVVAETLRPDFIDINFGCSVPKVLKNKAAAYLLKTPRLMGEVVRQTREALKPLGIPVSAKIRLGFEEDRLEEIVEELQKGGVSLIAIHARLAVQGFRGRANWKRIKDARKISEVPIVGNGDVKTWQDIERMFEETGCDGVMVGRAALSNPWIFKEYREKRTYTATLRERMDFILEELSMMREYMSEEKACAQIKSQIVQILKGLPGSRDLKTYIVRAGDCRDLLKRIREARERDSLHAGCGLG
ncbi:MAG: tRNA-dihydrouridine synthase family protein [Aquificae bacterium]|nr:tRNA-dihydrouridine synthase family protein [Aquificota bacterium]